MWTEKKKLIPRLPKDEKELYERGFEGNIGTGKKFITDGHLIFLSSEASPGMLFRASDPRGRDVSEEKMQKLWDEFVNKKIVPAHFIGCGKPYGKGDDTILAAVRDNRKRVIILNPYILGFAVLVVHPDSISVSASVKFYEEPVLLLREGKVVALVMAMRRDERDLENYDMTGPDFPIGG